MCITWIHCTLLSLILLSQVTRGAAGREPSAQSTVAKSIAWLERDMQTWRNEHGCAACHHGPMYLWSINVARRQGYPVNEPQLQDYTRWLLTDDEARIFPRSTPANRESATTASASDRMTAAMMGQKNLSQPTLYLTHAINALPDDEPLKTIGWQKVVDHLASAQSDSGSFAGRNGWRPIFNTPQVLTLFAASGIRDASASRLDAKSAQRQSDILKQAEAYLARESEDTTHQGVVLRILAAPAIHVARSDSVVRTKVESLVTRLVQLQRPDGGWSQTDDRDSDAFATGQTLVALHRAGLPATDLAVRRGIEFLLRTQQDDGTWPMTSRPNPETGKPATLLNPITYAATAWATMGLAQFAVRE